MTANEVKEAQPRQVQDWLEEQSATLFDIRELDERAREHIAGAEHAPLSQLDPKQMHGDRTKKAIFYCATGNRTREAGERLLGCGFAETYQLSGGLSGWRHAGLPTVVDPRAPLPLLRQVQIGAGGLVLVGVVLGYLWTPLWFGLSGFVGAGLMFAGLSGWCGMASLLSIMPWNRLASKASSRNAVEVN